MVRQLKKEDGGVTRSAKTLQLIADALEVPIAVFYNLDGKRPSSIAEISELLTNCKEIRQSNVRK